MNKLIIFTGQGFYNDIMAHKNLNKYFLSIDKTKKIEENIDIIISNKVSMIFPLKDDAQYVYENVKEFKEANIKYHLPTEHIMNSFTNKMLFHDFMVDNGFDQYVPKKYNEIKYPCIIKYKYSEYGIDTYIINSSADIPKNIDLNNYIINDVIYGNCEYVTHIFAKYGNIIIDSTNEYNFKTSIHIKGIRDKPHFTKKIKINNNIKSVFEQIVKKSNYSGMICIDYKIINNNPIIFEINPRIGGSLTIDETELEDFLVLYIKHCE